MQIMQLFCGLKSTREEKNVTFLGHPIFRVIS